MLFIIDIVIIKIEIQNNTKIMFVSTTTRTISTIIVFVKDLILFYEIQSNIEIITFVINIVNIVDW